MLTKDRGIKALPGIGSIAVMRAAVRRISSSGVGCRAPALLSSKQGDNQTKYPLYLTPEHTVPLSLQYTLGSRVVTGGGGLRAQDRNNIK